MQEGNEKKGQLPQETMDVLGLDYPMEYPRVYNQGLVQCFPSYSRKQVKFPVTSLHSFSLLFQQ